MTEFILIMNISANLSKMKNIQDSLLIFLESQNDMENDFQIFQTKIEQDNIIDKYFLDFLNLLLKIADNHHRTLDFNSRIDRILLFFKDSLTKCFSNHRLFNLFWQNKRILLFLIEEKIIIIDEFIFSKLKNIDSDFNYIKYLEPELISYFTQQSMKDTQTFSESYENNRKIGENDSYICHLIRNDLIDEFKNFAKQKKLKLSIKIKLSIFETNNFLVKDSITLIEYAAFCGSSQIFKYIFENQKNVQPTIWTYAIHGQNSEIIHLLEEKEIKPESYENCFNEAVKCFHNDLAKYIKDKYLQDTIIDMNNYLFLSFNNYNYFPDSFKTESILIYMCQLNYINLVKLVFNEIKEQIDINKII